jgi:hypothetical protein
VNPRYPVFIPTKGRSDYGSRLTIRTFEALGVSYRAIVEPQEVAKYAAAGVPRANLVVLPANDRGLVYARNFIWDLAESEGHEWYWTFDDNIRGLFRWNRNHKTPVVDATIMRVIEDFTMRYDNVPLSGMQYWMFIVRKGNKHPPIYVNHRVYSNMFLRTRFLDGKGRPYRSEGKYNDDTDLCLRVLKDGNCTLLFNAFLIGKTATMLLKGGMGYELSEVKEEDHRWIASEELRKKHPDVTRVTRKYGRWHHHVDYRPFRKNQLHLRPGVVVPQGTDNYGMILEKEQPDGSWIEIDDPLSPSIVTRPSDPYGIWRVGMKEQTG